MITITSNGVKLSLHTWSDFLSYAEHAVPDQWARIQAGQMPENETNYFWLLYPNLHWQSRYQQMFIQMPSFETNDSLLRAAGHDPVKIDYAVPQPWFEEYKQKVGEYPKAYWTYEKDGAFGEPLFYSTIRSQVRANVKFALDRIIDNFLSTPMGEGTHKLSPYEQWQQAFGKEATDAKTSDNHGA